VAQAATESPETPMSPYRHSPRTAIGAVAATAAIAFVAAFADPVFAADATGAADSANAHYLKDRADCNAGRTAEDRATCLKEAGAAQVERKRNQLDNNGSPAQNAADRCNVVPAKDKADCLARVQGPNAANQHVTTSGSVAGGGVLKETVTTTPGQLIIIPGTVAPAASAPN
jgi:hypothetical protein